MKILKFLNAILSYFKAPKIQVNRLKKYEYISFDIFDTVLERKIYDPHAVFDLMLPEYRNIINDHLSDFKTLRIAAENLMRRKTLLEEVTIDEIYSGFSEITGLNKNLIEKIKHLELKTERSLIEKRNIGWNIYNKALKLNKKIIFISDMYLSKLFIANILAENGYNKYYKLYISSNIKNTKNTGSMFEYVANDLKTKKILHFGDNFKDDIINSINVGFDAVYLKKTIELFARNIYFNFLFRNDLWSKIIVSQIAKKRYSDFKKFNKNSVIKKSSYLLGYSILGPFIFNHVFNINKYIANKNIDTILFVARDGYYAKKIYELINTSHIKTSYFITSRMAYCHLYINKSYNILNLVNYFTNSKKTFKDFFDFFFDHNNSYLYDTLQKNKISKNSLIDQNTDILLFIIKKHYDEIKLFLDKKQKIIKEYFAQYIKDSKNILIYDSGFNGSLQCILNNIFPQKIFYGYYIDTNYKICEIFLQENMYFSCFSNGDGFQNQIPFIEKYTSYYGASCIGYKYTAKRIIEEYNKADIDKIKDGMEIESGIIDMAKDILHFRPYLNKVIRLDIKQSLLIIHTFIKNIKTTNDNSIIGDTMYKDPFYKNDYLLSRYRDLFTNKEKTIFFITTFFYKLLKNNRAYYPIRYIYRKYIK